MLKKEDFRRMEFHAQDTYDHQEITETCFEIILHEGQSVGRLCVDRRETEIRVADIALLSGFRRQVIGNVSLGDLIAEFESSYKPLSILLKSTIRRCGIISDWNSKELDISKFTI